MVKTLSVFFLSLSLVFSILAPSALSLLNFDYNEVVLIDAEEDSQNELETGIDEDIKIIPSLSKFSNFNFREDPSVYDFHKENFKPFTSGVHLPPPEFFI